MAASTDRSSLICSMSESSARLNTCWIVAFFKRSPPGIFQINTRRVMLHFLAKPRGALMRPLLLTVLMTFNAVVGIAAGSLELMTAIRSGDHSRVQRLLSAGADANTADSDGTTA